MTLGDAANETPEVHNKANRVMMYFFKMYLLVSALYVQKIGTVLFTVVADELHLNVTITFLQGHSEGGFQHAIGHINCFVEISDLEASFDNRQRLAPRPFSCTDKPVGNNQVCRTSYGLVDFLGPSPQ